MAIGFNLSNKIGGAGGAEVYIDNVQVVLTEIRLKTSNIMPSFLPYDFTYGGAVVFNNELHILGGGYGTGSFVTHYKFNVSTSTWTSVSTLPYAFNAGLAVVFNNEINILSGASDNSTKHYKFNVSTSTWTSVSTLPQSAIAGSAVVFNNELHVLGGGGVDDRTKHIKWNGLTWTSVSTLPYNFYSGSAVVFNNKIQILGGNSSETYRAFFILNALLVESMS